MSFKHFFSTYRFITVIIVASAGLPAFAQDHAQQMPQPDVERHGPAHWQMQDKHIDSMLVTMANRLEIKSSQQTQWESFAAAFKALRTKPQHPNMQALEHSMDAATLAKAMADRMTERAAKMKTLASEAAQLQQVLSPEQQKTFNQMAQHLMRHAHKHPMGYGHAHHPWDAVPPRGVQ